MERKVYDKKPSECNCRNLRRASQAITDIYDEYIKPSGLKISQFGILRHIDRLGPVSVTDLALHMRQDRTTLVRNLKLIEEKGLVIDISESGTRNRQLQLTAAGARTFKEAEALWADAQQFLEQYLGKNDMDALTRLLSKIEALVP